MRRSRNINSVRRWNFNPEFAVQGSAPQVACLPKGNASCTLELVAAAQGAVNSVPWVQSKDDAWVGWQERWSTSQINPPAARNIQAVYAAAAFYQAFKHSMELAVNYYQVNTESHRWLDHIKDANREFPNLPLFQLPKKSEPIQDRILFMRPNGCQKTLVSLVGRITAIHGNTAFVSAINESTRERFDAECDAEFLKASGITENVEFLCSVTQKDGHTVLDFKPLPPKMVSDEEISRISKEVDALLD